MKKCGKALYCLILLVIIFPGLILQTSTAAESRTRANQSEEIDAPDFVLKDIKGRKFKLSDHRGKPVLIIFSTTWCTYCRSEIPHFKNIYATYTPKGLIVVNIDINESQEKVARFAARYQLPYRVLLDENGTVSDNYYVRGVPSMTLIDQRGKIVCLYCRSVEPMLDKLFENTGRKEKK